MSTWFVVNPYDNCPHICVWGPGSNELDDNTAQLLPFNCCRCGTMIHRDPRALCR